MTPQEIKAAELLGEAWNVYLSTKPKNKDDIDDFRRAIHEAQRIIAYQSAVRATPDFWRE